MSIKIKTFSFKSASPDSKFKIRFLPSNPPFIAFTEHWIPAGINQFGQHSASKKWFPITHSADSFCPFCEVIKTLDWKTQVRSKRTNYEMIAIVHDEIFNKKVGIRKVVCSPSIWKPLFNFSRKYGRPDDFETGYDFIISCHNTGLKRRYNITRMEPCKIKEIPCEHINLIELRSFPTQQQIRESLSSSGLPLNIKQKISNTIPNSTMNKYRFIQMRC